MSEPLGPPVGERVESKYIMLYGTESHTAPTVSNLGITGSYNMMKTFTPLSSS